jgi:putative DNA primase/helicase
MEWANGNYASFVLGSKVIGRAGILPPAAASGIGAGLSLSGSVDDWKEHIGKTCMGNPLMILAVSLAFSGPLLAPLGLLGGGLHFRGASSSGKTTLLNLSASVWGGRQLISQWRATSNGLEAIAATMNDMLLPLDEIAEITARNLYEAIYMLANGTGKARMTKDVTLADQVRWRLALISSGEISVEEKLKEGRLSSMAGHEVRLIDVEADSRTYGAFDNIHNAENAATFAEQIQQAARRHHGAVGHSFVRRLIEDGSISRSEDLKKMVDQQVSIWIRKTSWCSGRTDFAGCPAFRGLPSVSR